MSAEPPVRRVIAFFDGQNLYHAVRVAFGHTYPNYDVKALAQSLCTARGWLLDQVRFYTGVPDATDNAFWSGFWAAKLLAMSRQGVWTLSRPLRYRNQTVKLPDGTTHAFLAAEEKGAGVRIARCDSHGAPPRVRRGARFQPGSGSLGSRWRSARDCN